VPGIAERSAAPGLVAVDERDPPPLVRDTKRAREADDTGPDDEDAVRP
jgi:hypothetical protein